MIAQRYQDLDCWQLSNDLKIVCTPSLQAAGSKDFEFCDQIRRSHGRAANYSEGSVVSGRRNSLDTSSSRVPR